MKASCNHIYFKDYVKGHLVPEILWNLSLWRGWKIISIKKASDTGSEVIFLIIAYFRNPKSVVREKNRGLLPLRSETSLIYVPKQKVGSDSWNVQKNQCGYRIIIALVLAQLCTFFSIYKPHLS